MSRRSVKLYRARDPRLPIGNFGDEISVPILDRLFDIEAMPTRYRDAELICAGSILDFRGMRLKHRLRNALSPARLRVLHVWGAGFMAENSHPGWPQTKRFHAVRGKLSAARIGGFDGAIGDPGILASRIVEAPPKSAKVALVPHYVDAGALEGASLPPGWTLVRPDRPCLSVIGAIAGAEMVVSSSLHGLIVADGFGIPAVWALSDRPLMLNSLYKFHDHASARGIPFNEPAPYDRLFRCRPSELEAMATVVARDIGAWQEELIRAFPFRGR